MAHHRMHTAVIETINTSTTSRDVRTGVTTSVVEEFTETRADRLVSTNIAQTMRARDIIVTGENFKPLTSIAETTLKLRSDQVQSRNIREQIIKNSPQDNEDYFVVPKVIE